MSVRTNSITSEDSGFFISYQRVPTTSKSLSMHQLEVKKLRVASRCD